MTDENENIKNKNTAWSCFIFKDLENGYGKQMVSEIEFNGEMVYIIPSRYKHVPREAGMYLHTMPRKLISMAGDVKDIYIVEVLFLKREIRILENQRQETTMEIITSDIFVPRWVMKKNPVSLLFRSKNCIQIWIEDEAKRKEFLDLLQYEEQKKWNIHNPFFFTDSKTGTKKPLRGVPEWSIGNSGMIFPPEFTQLKKTDILEISRIPFTPSITKTISNELKEKGPIKITMGVGEP